MGAGGFIGRMDQDELVAFNQYVRACRYGKLDLIVSWLAERGVSSSRSAVARYAAELKRCDGVSGMAGSFSVAVGAVGADLTSLQGLYRRLGEVEFERDQLLRLIREKVALDQEDQAEQGAQ